MQGIAVKNTSGADFMFTLSVNFEPNPLSYVAECNVNPAGNGFVTDLTAYDISGYFNYENAAQFNNTTIGGKQYHLPSIEEWRSIVPENTLVYYGSNNSYNNQTETVKVAGTTT
ncbi:MAG: hypothetical protein ACOX19_05520 [Fermentimonas sp.]